MPIDPIVLQRRHAEVGRIRLGEKRETRGGGSRPAKLESLRFTSPNKELIDQVAAIYGGEARAWDNGGMPEFEVLTPAKSVPIIVVKGGVSQWMETWSGGGCVHRCDGVRDATTKLPCDPEDPAHKAARPTTRLSVMLREIETMGVWRIETHGYNAAAEIPMIAELAAYVGDLVPATLHLVERRQVSDGETKRFVVPVVDLGITKAGLLAAIEAAGGGLALDGPPPAKEIAAPPADPPPADGLPVDRYLSEILSTTDLPELGALWREIRDRGHLYPDVREMLEARSRVLSGGEGQSPTEEATQAQSPAQRAPEGDQGEVVDGELIDSDPIEDDRAWQDLIATAAEKGIPATKVAKSYEEWAGFPVADGNAASYRSFAEEVIG